MRIGNLEVSSGFLVLSAWLFYQDRSGVFWLAMLACLLHELGHYAVLRYFRKSVKSIHITVFGAEMILGNTLSYRQEFLSAAAGPGMNLFLAWMFCRFPDGASFAGLNFALALLNLLPIGTLDGGRMLRCGLSHLFSDKISFLISEHLSFCFTVCFLFVGTILALKGGNLTLFFVCLWMMKRPMPEKTFGNGRKRMEIGLVRRFRNS